MIIAWNLRIFVDVVWAAAAATIFTMGSRAVFIFAQLLLSQRRSGNDE
jgi:hypothetical protein